LFSWKKSLPGKWETPFSWDVEDNAGMDSGKNESRPASIILGRLKKTDYLSCTCNKSPKFPPPGKHPFAVQLASEVNIPKPIADAH